MDRSVPLAAARILDFIRQTEVGTDGPSGYNVIYGFNQDKLPEPVTRMTVDELIGAQSSFTKLYGSSASGGYQFMRATLTDLKRELGLRGSQLMDPDLQDRLAFHLLKRRGYEQFMAGTISLTEFGKRLAMEWASFPVLADTKGAHRQVTRGSTYYSGDKLNKALVEPEEIESLLRGAKELGDAMPAQVPVPTPRPETKEPAMTAEQQPAPIGHNGGPAMTPDLTPIESTNKANKGGAGSLAGSGLGGAIVYLWSTTGSFPTEWSGDPQAMVAVTLIVMSVTGAIGSWWAAYKARDYRLSPKDA
ncbi:hypothetical protein DYI37_03035 [Fulvimarina endophytica]|uniref:Transmembrane protein n=2 Tax=Fulvimarina endophytica TaxID=2293836 RepID=A0A371XB64_9HYPH|nr:hypothetical protein DYI37_03035 [Fulvimarina endophytica]